MPAVAPRTRADVARQVASAVVDPELPMLTLADLGVLRSVEIIESAGGDVVEVTLTPTYTGCPALATMRDDVVADLQQAGFAQVRVAVVLDPPWSSDWITAAGRRALAQAGISPPGSAPARGGPVPLRLGPVRRAVRCPRCGADDVALTSEFGATACVAMYRCRACAEPFDHVKEI